MAVGAPLLVLSAVLLPTASARPAAVPLLAVLVPVVPPAVVSPRRSVRAHAAATATGIHVPAAAFTENGKCRRSKRPVLAAS